MLNIQNLSFRIEGRLLFDNASANIPKGHKVGLVGRNGTGKTTLFRLIKSEWTPESGLIFVPKDYKVGGVDQEAPSSENSLLDTVLISDKERNSLLKEAENAVDPTRITEIQNRLADINSHTAESRASTILAGLGFDHNDQKRPCREFSGGWRMRVALASTLFSNPDLLLLDEPTNYLDIEGSIWLENFISKYQNTVLIISHDRGLLNNSLDGILHLFDNKLNYYKGNYDKYEKTRRLKLEMQISMKKKQDAQRTHIQSFIDRFRSKASKAKQAQSRLKQLEKMQPIIGVTESSVSPFKFPSPKEIAPPLIKIENGSVGYDENVVLDNLNISIDHEDRIALLGANGEGKSTFSKLLAGKINLIKGNISKSKKLKVGFFAQHQLEELEIGKSPFEHFLKEFPSESISNIRSKLGAAGIGADISDNPVENLSGGQKARLMMALATIDAPHILILDEPTNHLDIESRESLVHAINDYTGSVIIVSHDVHLVEMVADRLWLVKDGRVSNYESDIEDYRKKLLLSKSKKQNLKSENILNGKLLNQETLTTPNSLIKICENKIELLIRKKNSLQELLLNEKNQSFQEYQLKQIKQKIIKISQEIEVKEKEWLDLQKT